MTLCEIPPILSSVSKIDFTKQYTHDWMMDKLITSLMPEDRIFLPSTARSQLRSIGNVTPNSAGSISAEGRPVITFPPSAKYSLSSAVQINSNALLSIAPPTDISDEERDSGTCSEMYQSAACSEMHQSTACSEVHQSAACSESKEVLSPPKQSSKKFQQFMSLLKRKGNSTSAPSTSFSSGATSGFHSQSSSNIRSLENANDYMDDTSL